MPRNPCLRVWSETHSIPLIQSALLKKVSFFLQNDALIAILIVKGRESVFWKACGELCHVVGSGKTRNRKKHAQKVKRKKWFLVSNLPLCFRPNPGTGVGPFHNRSNPCFRVWPECTGILSSRSCAKLALFYQCLCDTGKKRALGCFLDLDIQKVSAQTLKHGSRQFPCHETRV